MGPLLILLCTLIWGTAFLFQKTGAEHYGPFALTCYRNILAGLFLWAAVAVRNRFCAVARNRRSEFFGGALSGVVLFAAMTAQQIGIEHTTPGISAFLTANYILLVPVLAWVAGRGRPGVFVWAGVACALAGSYLISVGGGEGFGMGRGELWTLLCAVLFAVQIMVVDRYARGCDVLRFSMVQTFVAGLCAAPFLMLPSEASRLTVAHFAAGWFSLFYVGILSSGIAYTLQNLGQARTSAPIAAILMSFESVVGAVSGWLALGDAFTLRQIAGCALVFSAVILTQSASARRCAANADMM